MKQLLTVAPSKPTEIMENTAPCGIGAKSHIAGRRQGQGSRTGTGKRGRGAGLTGTAAGTGAGHGRMAAGLYANRQETGANIS